MRIGASRLRSLPSCFIPAQDTRPAVFPAEAGDDRAQVQFGGLREIVAMWETRSNMPLSEARSAAAPPVIINEPAPDLIRTVQVKQDGRLAPGRGRWHSDR
jgi:hypothetical protein